MEIRQFGMGNRIDSALELGKQQFPLRGWEHVSDQYRHRKSHPMLVEHHALGKRGFEYMLTLFFHDYSSEQKNKTIYSYRQLSQCPNLVRVLSFAAGQASFKFDSLSRKNKVHLLITQPIIATLSQLRDLQITEVLYFIHGILSGMSQLIKFFGLFQLHPSMVGLSDEGTVKVWVNSDFSSNELELAQPQNKIFTEQESIRSIYHMAINFLTSDNQPSNLRFSTNMRNYVLSCKKYSQLIIFLTKYNCVEYGMRILEKRKILLSSMLSKPRYRQQNNFSNLIESSQKTMRKPLSQNTVKQSCSFESRQFGLTGDSSSSNSTMTHFKPPKGRNYLLTGSTFSRQTSFSSPPKFVNSKSPSRSTDLSTYQKKFVNPTCGTNIKGLNNTLGEKDLIVTRKQKTIRSGKLSEISINYTIKTCQVNENKPDYTLPSNKKSIYPKFLKKSSDKVPKEPQDKFFNLRFSEDMPNFLPFYSNAKNSLSNEGLIGSSKSQQPGKDSQKAFEANSPQNNNQQFSKFKQNRVSKLGSLHVSSNNNNRPVKKYNFSCAEGNTQNNSQQQSLQRKKILASRKCELDESESKKQLSTQRNEKKKITFGPLITCQDESADVNQKKQMVIDGEIQSSQFSCELEQKSLDTNRIKLDEYERPVLTGVEAEQQTLFLRDRSQTLKIKQNKWQDRSSTDQTNSEKPNFSKIDFQFKTRQVQSIKFVSNKFLEQQNFSEIVSELDDEFPWRMTQFKKRPSKSYYQQPFRYTEKQSKDGQQHFPRNCMRRKTQRKSISFQQKHARRRSIGNALPMSHNVVIQNGNKSRIQQQINPAKEAQPIFPDQQRETDQDSEKSEDLDLPHYLHPIEQTERDRNSNYDETSTQALGKCDSFKMQTLLSSIRYGSLTDQFPLNQ